MKFSPLALVAVSAALAAPMANAADVSSGLYSGIGVNNTIVHTKKHENLYNVDKNNTRAASAFVGYKFNNWFSTEVGFNDLGTIKMKEGGDVSSKAYGLSAIGEIPVYAGFIGYARVGAAYVDSSNLKRGDDVKHNQNTAPVYGLGIKYQFEEVPVFTRLEYTRYDIDSKFKLDTTNLSFGVQF